MSTMTISQPDAKFQSGMRALPAIVSHKNVPESQISILPFSINDSTRNTRFRSNSAGRSGLIALLVIMAYYILNKI